MSGRRILYVQYTNPASLPPLEHSSRILAQHDWQILFLGIQAPETKALQFPFHPRIMVRQLRYCPPGWRQKIHYVRFFLWVTCWVIRWRPHWIYASDPLSCALGFVLSFIPGIKVLYHEHDSPNSADSQIEPSIFMRLIFWSRRRLARRARIRVLPNEERAQQFFSNVSYHDDTFSVWNCPVLEEAVLPRHSMNEKVLRLLYHGSIVPDRVPPTIFRALTLLPGAVEFRVIGYETIGHRGYVQELRDFSDQLSLNRRVEFMGPMPRGDVLKHSLDCHIGFTLIPCRTQEINLRTLVGASNKAFDYLACGLALIVPDLLEWKKTFVNPGYGLACDPDDPQSIADAVRWFLEHPEETRAMGEKGRQRILQEWNYEKQFLPVLQKLNGVL